MQSASDTFSEALIISNWYKHRACETPRGRGKWIGHARLLAEVPSTSTEYLIQNSQAVKKVCGPQKGYGEKRCEIQGGGQEMAVMVG